MSGGRSVGDIAFDTIVVRCNPFPSTWIWFHCYNFVLSATNMFNCNWIVYKVMWWQLLTAAG